MFGIDDPGIYMAYLLMFVCVVYAVVFGIKNWNKGQEPTNDDIKKVSRWEKKEKKINAKFKND